MLPHKKNLEINSRTTVTAAERMMKREKDLQGNQIERVVR